VPTRQAILVFSRLANGDVAPLRIIAGPKTRINRARGIAVDPVYNIIAEALGPSGEILAYTMENGRDENDGQTVSLPDWKDPLFATYDTGALGDVSATFLGASLFGDDFVWIEGSTGGAFNLSRRFAAPGDPIAFYSDPGNADPIYTALERAEGVTFNQDEEGGVAESFRRIGGDLVTTNVDVNLGASGVLLPRLNRPTLTFTGDPEHVRLVWTANGSVSNADGGFSLLVWLRGEVEAEGQHVWGLIHAPGTSVNAPPALDDRFWPRNDPSDFIIPFWVQIEDASFLTGYDEYRLAMRFGGVLRPFGQLPYTTRHTRYFTFPGSPEIIDASIGKLKLGGR